MYKIAVVGDYDSIYGFATLGLDIFPVTSRKEAEEKLEHLAASKYGIIYITEALAAECKKTIDKFQEGSEIIRGEGCWLGYSFQQ